MKLSAQLVNIWDFCSHTEFELLEDNESLSPEQLRKNKNNNEIKTTTFLIIILDLNKLDACKDNDRHLVNCYKKHK